jgi:hypothetical protein
LSGVNYFFLCVTAGHSSAAGVLPEFLRFSSCVDGPFDAGDLAALERLVSGHDLEICSHDYLTLPGHFGHFEPLGPSKTQ